MGEIRAFIRSLPGASLLRKILGRDNDNWTRVVMNRETEKLVDGLNPSSFSVLEISGTRWSAYGRFKQYASVHYPDFDVCRDILPGSYDLIIAEQVFEHLLWPYRGGKNVFRMLGPGGHFLISTPFLLPIHNVPHDCTRWTETGLRYFLAECGFPPEKIRTSSWGNRRCVRANFDGWARYHRGICSLQNESNLPVVVWALAMK